MVIPSAATRPVLVVDDDPVAREYAAALLRGAGFSDVRGAADGTEALRRLDEAPCALLVCDLRMAGMDGVALMRHLAGRSFDAPILLVSGTGDRMLTAVAAGARAQGLNLVAGLRKPLDRFGLHRALLAADLITGTPRAPSAPEPDAATLRAALDDGAIDIWLQPVFGVDDGALKSVEALARWDHPDEGILPAAAFMPLAERVGLGTRLTDRVLDRALAFVRRWRGVLECPVSIGLSAADLRDAGTVERLVARVEASGATPSDIHLEVSERHLVDPSELTIEVLARLRLRGFGLVIDDFGTGWSSLALLSQLPFGELKIDARFVLAAPSDPSALGIVESSVQLARRLGMRVTAKGVEVRAQHEVCRRFGLDAAQGCLLGRPLPAEVFAARFVSAAA
jgi:EAL domain-containing protein (putative c-di-GMP-specific phosphodiesterase class I)/ActR/RegA family two-component response regulator